MSLTASSRLLLFTVFLFLLSCEEEPGITAEDHFLNYDVPFQPVEEDYQVGALYTYNNFTPNVTAEPMAGRYEAASPAAYAEHLEAADRAGIDFFLFPLRGSHVPAQFAEDSSRLATLLAVGGADEQGFALAYDIGNFNLNNGPRRIERAPGMLVDKFIGDLLRLADAFFDRPNYAEVEGRKVVYLTNAHNLFASDNAALYAQLRTTLAGTGHELYLIGEQPAWTPPGRYDFRFEGGVDAVSMSRYVEISNGFYNRFQLFETMVDQAWQYNAEVFQQQGLDFVPQVSPAFDRRITAPPSRDFVFERDSDGSFFALYANLARRAATRPLVIVDSFNDFRVDSQIEPTTGYGDTFVEAVRQEFKRN
jgi:hypothetical protein